MQVQRSKRNLYLLAISFFFAFSAYKMLAGIQGSINKSIGTISLSCLYTSMVISAFFFAPLAMSKFGCKVMMSFGILCYSSYTAASFYPKVYTLVPAGALAGIGAGLLYPSMVYYINCLAKEATEAADSPKISLSKTTSVYFGIFYTFLNSTFTFGGLCMSVIVQMNDTKNETQHAYNESTSSVDGISEFNNKSISSECGLYYYHSGGTSKLIDDSTMYILLAVFMLFYLISFVLMLLLDDIRESNTTNYMNEEVCKENYSKEHQFLNQEDAQHPKFKNAKRKLISAFHLLQKDNLAVLLIVFSFHYGVIDSFVPGVFNASWITCTLGINYVAYTSITYGVMLAAGSFCFGQLMRWWTHIKMFILVAILEVSLLTVLLIWKPEENSYHWLYFCLSMSFAVCQSAQAGQLASVYSRFFFDKEASSALLFVWDPLGGATSYVVASFASPIVTVVFMLSICVVGTALYLVAEYRLLNKRPVVDK